MITFSAMFQTSFLDAEKQILNPKHEILNKSKILISKHFELLDLDIV